MTSSRTTRSLPWNLILIFLLLAVAIGVTGGFYYQTQKDQIKKHEEDTLSAIADMKTKQISAWLKERRGDAEVILKDLFMARQVERLLATSPGSRLEKELLARMKSLADAYQYQNVLLLDSEKKVRLRLNRESAGVGPVASGLVDEAVRTRQVVFSDLHRTGVTPAIHLDLLIPLLVQHEDQLQPVGVLLLRIDPHQFLYPLIQSWPTPSASSESILVRREGDRVLFLNELRHRKDTALSLATSVSEVKLPAAMAARGHEGIVEGLDYRGVPVLAALRKVPDSPWFLVAKVDAEEVYAPIRERGRLVLGLTGVLILAAGAGVGLLWRNQRARFYREQYQAQEAILRERSLSESLVNSLPGILYLFDEQGKFLRWNRKFEEVTGYSAAEIAQMTPLDFFVGEEKQLIAKRIQRVFTTGQADAEANLVAKNGQPTPYYFTGVLIQIDGKPCLIGMGIDITERKRAEAAIRQINEELEQRVRERTTQLEAANKRLESEIAERHLAEAVLRESEERFRQMADNIQEVFWMSSPDITKIIYISPAFEKIWGRPCESVYLNPLSWVEAIHPDDREGVLQALEKHAHGEYDAEYRIVRPDGSVRWIHDRGFPVRDEAGQIIRMVGIAEDTTKRQQAEEAIREAETRYRTLFEQAPDGVLIVDPETAAIIEFNEAAHRQLGYSRQEFGTLRIPDIEAVEKPEDIKARIERILRTGRDDFETQHRTKTGEVRNVLVTVQKVNLLGREVLHSIFRDITELKRAEEAIKRLNEDLERRAAELEASNKELEGFSYSVSHDLRAPLRAIDGFSRILMEDYGPHLPDEARRYLGLVRKNTQQMGTLIDELLTFSRLSRQPMKKETISPLVLVSRALEQLRAEQQGRRIEFITSELPACQGDPTLLTQVFVNLLSNALKFTRSRDVARIEVGALGISDFRLQIADWKSPAMRSEISNLQSPIYYVRDNGVGFDMRYADKLFGVFQRLHRAEDYEGTGVGLAIVQRIIHRHGGHVWAEAEVEKGATFYFTIGE